jgi:WD40 repeat protein
LAASGHVDGTVLLWAIETENVGGGGAAIGRLERRTLCAVSLDGTFIACGDGDGSVYVADASSGEVIASAPAHARRVRVVAIDPSSRLVATASEEGVLQLADAGTGALIARASGFWPQTAGSIVFSPDGTMIAAATGDLSIRLLTVPGLVRVRDLPSGGSRESLSAAWSPDGRRIATTAREGILQLWSVDGTLLSSVVSPSQPWTLAFSPDGTTIAMGTWGRTVDLHDANTLALRGQLGGSAGLFSQVAWLAPTMDGQSKSAELLASSVDGAVRVWDTRDMHLVFEFTPFEGSDVLSCSTDTAGHRFAASGSSGEAACWDLRRWDLRATLNR